MYNIEYIKCADQIWRIYKLKILSVEKIEFVTLQLFVIIIF